MSILGLAGINGKEGARTARRVRPRQRTVADTREDGASAPPRGCRPKGLRQKALVSDWPQRLPWALLYVFTAPVEVSVTLIW